MVAGDRSNPRTRRISDDGASLRRHIITTSCANFGLRRTAENNRHAFSQEAVDTVRKNFYVGKPKAVVLVDELRQLLAKGGFRLTKWISNSRNVLDTVWASERAGTVQDLLLDRLPMERALGVRWDEESDTFDFTITIKDKPPTKRSILSVVSSVYDPLGFFCSIHSASEVLTARPMQLWRNFIQSTPPFRRCLATRVWCRHLSPSHKH